MASQTGLSEYIRRGAHDDGREGILLARIAAGYLVKVPFGSGVVASSGGLAHNIGSSTAAVQSTLTSNPDSSGAGVNFSVTTGLGQGAAWTEQLYGSTIGIRWRRNNSSTQAPFGVTIDGVAYSVRNARYHSDSVLTTAGDHESLWIVADDLDPNVPHTVRVIAISDPYGGTTKSLLGYGWLLEKSAGYKDPPRWGTTASPAALSTSNTALSAGSVYRKILLANTGATARIVTLKSGSNVLAKRYLAISGTAGDTAEIDFGVGVPGQSGFTLSQDVGTDVFWTPVFAEVR